MSDQLSNNKNHDTNFGFKPVSFDEKKKLVQNVFDSVAPKYDLMNDLMSFGLHRAWKKSFVDMITLQENNYILDMAGGTGDISFKLHEKAKKQHININIINADLTYHMLQTGVNRAIDRGILNGIDYTNTDAQSLPFLDETFSHYVISFGLRNVPSRAKALSEAMRVLKKGGKFYCLEFSHIFLSPLQKIYQNYAFKFIPKLGEKISQDKNSYQYLVESIEKFPKQEDLALELRQAGFDNVNFRNLSLGLVAIHYGTKL
jgi:demethylmenaquinone methyltransferase / 2-methoxy-6-polyprenyl-1,4-benzoquinol methylase